VNNDICGGKNGSAHGLREPQEWQAEITLNEADFSVDVGKGLGVFGFHVSSSISHSDADDFSSGRRSANKPADKMRA
jgi:hypothetical protein